MKYINVISGKGGTGKTLLCATLAELMGNQNVSVLIIDMDFFVRGLTSLLYFHKGEALQLTQPDEKSSFDYFRDEKNQYNKQLGIYKYRSFFVSPSVNRIDENISLDGLILNSKNYYEKGLERIIKSIPQNKFDYVFFDSRAGYDELISTTSDYCDFSICVQEEDNISEITANNLIKQLENDNPRKPVFRLVNKVRNIKNYEDLESVERKGVSYIGAIPFDMDVLNSFGEFSFWEEISKSLYKQAVARTWNKLATKMQIDIKLNYKRYSPVGSEYVENKLNILSSFNRILVILGVLMAGIGISYSFIGKELFNLIDSNPERLISLVIGLFGIAITIVGVLDRKRKKRTPNKL